MAIDKEYKTVEAIDLMCYSFGLIMVCVTKFVPFIFFTLVAYPISFKVLEMTRDGGK